MHSGRAGKLHFHVSTRVKDSRLKLGGHESDWRLCYGTWLFILVLHRGPRLPHRWLVPWFVHQLTSKLSQLTSCHLALTPLQSDRLWRTVLFLDPIVVLGAKYCLYIQHSQIRVHYHVYCVQLYTISLHFGSTCTRKSQFLTICGSQGDTIVYSCLW